MDARQAVIQDARFTAACWGLRVRWVRGFSGETWAQVRVAEYLARQHGRAWAWIKEAGKP